MQTKKIGLYTRDHAGVAFGRSWNVLRRLNTLLKTSLCTATSASAGSKRKCLSASAAAAHFQEIPPVLCNFVLSEPTSSDCSIAAKTEILNY